jgi:LysM repeat protein
MSIMAMLPKLSPGVEFGAQRANESSLGLEAAAPAGPSAAEQTGATSGAQQATLGAEGVQPVPPSPLKIILGSVLKGAMTGASMAFGLNSMGGEVSWLVKILHFIPIPAFQAITKLAPLVVLAGGAAVGGVLGLIGGIKASKQATAEFNKATEASQQQPVAVGSDGQPIDPNAAVAPAPVDPGLAPSNPVMDASYKARKAKATKAKRKKAAAAAARKRGHKYHIVWGDTLGALARRYGTTVSAIQAANPNKIKNVNLIYAGDTIVIPGRAHKH